MFSKHTLSRSVRRFGFAVAVGGAGLGVMVGCPGVTVPPDDGNGGGDPTAARFVGAATCLACHADTHANWTETAHATALESLEAIGQGENGACLGCHTVGFDDGGFVSRAVTPDLAGVQCENCHGAGADHAAAPGDLTLRPAIDLSSSVCGACHTDAHHPTFDEWQLSKHAVALDGLRANAFAQDQCLECHSADFRYAIEQQEAGEAVEVPTLATAALSIECATCHTPHGGVPQDHQLRLPIANLCGECHTQEEAILGDSPHHPQIEMLTGTGAFQMDGAGLELTHVHSSLAAAGGEACAQCHVVRHEVEEPDDGNPNVTGHTFNPFDESITTHQAAQYTGCLDCHTDTVADGLRTALQSDLAARLDALAPVFDAMSASFIDPETLGEGDQVLLSTAKFNYQFVDADGSRGVHNPTLARGALDVAEEIIGNLQGQ